MTVETWDWSEENPEVERRSARQLLTVDDGDRFESFIADMVVECHGVVDRPGHRRVYFEEQDHGARLVFYVVRDKYVFCLDPDDEMLITADWTDDDEALFDEVEA